MRRAPRNETTPDAGRLFDQDNAGPTPDEWARLLEDPASLPPIVVEELRWAEGDKVAATPGAAEMSTASPSSGSPG